MKTILCFGDSNTFGTNASGGRFSRSERWTGILQELLGDGYYVIEEGCEGRTIVWDDPIEEYKNGKNYMMPCLHSHRPIDLLVIMLGTNDLKNRFSLSATDIQWAMENLIDSALQSGSGVNEGAPEILLMCPIQLGDTSVSELGQIFIAAEEKCRQLPELYRQLAARKGVYYLDAGEYAEADAADGVHIPKERQKNIAAAVCEKIKSIFGTETV